MKNKWLKKGVLLLAAGCLALSVAGCKGEQVIDQVLEKTDPKKNVEEEDKEKKAEENLPEIDVAKPELTVNLSGSVTYQVGETPEPLKIEASTTDGGVITYQWYQTKTNATGGGTVIDGAVENTYTPSTAEEGTMYYYAVATSTIQGSSNGVTSDSVEVIVSNGQEGEAGQEKKEEEQKQEEASQEKPAEGNGQTDKEGEAGAE